ncbi:MAG: glutamine synthetase, partial [Acidimicrobiales bacterium]|nr:glutamine synthetase [Acidimicrobiales bacterium]
LGFRVESINGEFDMGQFELTLEFDDAMDCADEVFLFRTMAMEVAAQKGHLLTFMPRPIPEYGGNGLHVNLSLEDSSGNNAMVDLSTPDGLSAIAKFCIAGQLHHMSAMAALCAPTANSYKRLLPGQISGYWKNWGHDHRSATVRVNLERDASTRLENRMPDGAASTHSAIAAVLTASRLGVEASLPCPDPETGDALETACTDEHTPDHLGAAIEALQADEKFTDAIGPEMVAQYIAIKEAEWAKYLAANGSWEETIGAFTEWEKQTYLPYL